MQTETEVADLSWFNDQMVLVGKRTGVGEVTRFNLWLKVDASENRGRNGLMHTATI